MGEARRRRELARAEFERFLASCPGDSAVEQQARDQLQALYESDKDAVVDHMSVSWAEFCQAARDEPFVAFEYQRGAIGDRDIRRLADDVRALVKFKRVFHFGYLPDAAIRRFDIERSPFVRADMPPEREPILGLHQWEGGLSAYYIGAWRGILSAFEIQCLRCSDNQPRLFLRDSIAIRPAEAPGGALVQSYWIHPGTEFEESYSHAAGNVGKPVLMMLRILNTSDCKLTKVPGLGVSVDAAPFLAAFADA